MSHDLSDLLARRARQASAVHPTMDGVQSAIGDRAKRRKRHRAIGSGLAALCLLAGAVGGFALSHDDDGLIGPVAGPSGAIDGVPVVGIGVAGWRQTAVDPDVSGADFMDWESDVAVFHEDEGASIAPFISVSRLDAGPNVDVAMTGDPVDLGSGITGYADDIGVGWTQADGNYAFISSLGVAREDLVAYARRLTAAPVELDSLPAPDGFPAETVAKVWDRTAIQTRTEYENGGGTVTVEVTDQPAWAEVVVDNDYPSFSAEDTVEVGPNPLGAGVALLREVEDDPTMTIPGAEAPFSTALWRTPSGLQVRLTAEGASSRGLVRQVLEQGQLVLLDEDGSPVEQPTPTTTNAPASTTSTVPVTTTSIGPVGGDLRFVDLTRTVDDDTETIDLEFDIGIPDYRNVAVLEEPAGDCAPQAPDFERYWLEGGDEVYWQGWLTIEVDADVVAVRGPVFGPDNGYILCTEGPAPSTIAIPVESLGEPTVTGLSGRPVLHIELPR